MTDPNHSRDSEPNPHDPKDFDWPLAFEAEKILHSHLNAFLTANRFARRLSDRMRDDTSTDFFEWIDHIVLPPDAGEILRGAGFVAEAGVETPEGEVVLHHPRVTLP